MYAKPMNNLEIVKLEKMYTYLPSYLDVIIKYYIPFVEVLADLTDKETLHKNEMDSKIQISIVGFPFIKRHD